MLQIAFKLSIILFTIGNVNAQDSLYTESPIVLETATGKIYGTLTMPKTDDKVPIVLFIAGSGPTDRNGNSQYGLKTNCTAQLAHALVSAKIASVRYDKRGVAESTNAAKSEANVTFVDFVNDASAWMDFLKKDTRFATRTIIGHSEGALIGIITAQNRADKFISLAGAGQSADIILKTQLKKQLPDSLYNLYSKSIDSLNLGYNFNLGYKLKDISFDFMGLLRPSVQPFLMSWFKYNPEIEIKKLNIPILIIQGAKDIQVSVIDAQRLKEAQAKSDLVIINNMNHVLKDINGDEKENLQSYYNPNLPINETMVKSIIHFIKNE